MFEKYQIIIEVPTKIIILLNTALLPFECRA